MVCLSITIGSCTSKLAPEREEQLTWVTLPEKIVDSFLLSSLQGVGQLYDGYMQDHAEILPRCSISAKLVMVATLHINNRNNVCGLGPILYSKRTK